VAFYSDKHGIFRVNAKDAIGGDRVTQFGRVLSELNIDIICANSPRAKGRVERAFGTLQDRLVKELRLAGISTMEAANAWVPAFMANYNARFGRDPENAKDLHRELTDADDLSEVLAWREERTVTKNLTLHYDRMMLMLDPTPLARGLARRTVDVVNYPDGRFAVQFEGVSLPFRKFDKIAGSAGGISPPAAHGTVRKPLDLHGSSQPLSCRLTTTVDAESDRSSRFLGWRPPSLSWVIRFAPRPLQAPRRYYRMIRPLHAHRYFPPSCSALIGFSLSIA
jgi:hypothetical protein